ncbi:HipA N-terminal domain-containing protein [Pedobacter hartonius]|uniref:Serine/threonine-protein kinase HipA n=1 Tax=Pedobacter hartonius TaxID=425514 RepID=A0A1H3ZXB0_9SPHI|nr:HipA N-terminal domain-containing protein [Pedobacter hartonius]SEA28329.1 serine/threonine-protein kinase HipA [Pedobacter hartonius]
MRKAKIFYNKILAGSLIEEGSNNYVFTYDEHYYNDHSMPAISLTLPKLRREYRSTYLFPFFYNMLAEGVNKQLQSRQFRIDEEDAFGLLLATAGNDTIGAITVKPSNDEFIGNN